MTSAETVHAKPGLTFPGDIVASTLLGELIAAVQSEAARKGVALPKAPDELIVAAIEIDSLTVVEILCVLDDILPFQVDDRVVRPGGYQSIRAAVDHVLIGVEKRWIKHHSGGKK